MTDNVLDEFLAEDESLPGYTDAEANAIHQAIKLYLKADTDFHGKILFSIVQVVDAVSGGGAHPHNVLYESGIQDDLTALLAKLNATASHLILA